jgi:hypothetical protein
MLGLGAVPAAAVLYLRLLMPESPRYPSPDHMFARQVADLAASHGRTGLADEMTQRFDELDDDEDSPKGNDGGTHGGGGIGPST